MSKLTHLDAEGHARMVEVGDKAITQRSAVAEGAITLSTTAFEALVEGRVPKGDVLAVARLAGITAAKRTSDLIPLCHPIPLTGVAVDVTPEAPDTIRVKATVRCEWRTGVEMEALTAVSAALLTVYDLEKRGGRSGTWQRASRD